MTLVVARQINNEIYIIGDSKFTENIKHTRGESKSYIGGLKVIILTPGLCIGFAGNIEYARNAIQGIYESEVNLFDKNCVVDYFLNQHKNSVATQFPTDFIVAVISESNEISGKFVKEIFKISDSKVAWENETSYVGDRDAYNCFQEVFHNGNANYINTPTLTISRLGSIERPNFDHSISTALQAMQVVIDNKNISSVDGVCVTVISEEDQFKYAQYIQVRSVPNPVNNQPFSPVSFGGAAEGSDIKQCGIHTVVGIGIYTVYWITGKFGVIYNPEKCFEPIIVCDCTQDSFCSLVQKQISITHKRAINYQSRF